MLRPAFYEQPTCQLARDLLGRDVVRILDGQRLVGRIVEVEAYHQTGDAASHSFNGPTPRNRVMFGPAGRLYVYLIYGVHFCMNVVSEAPGVGAAVLIRGLEPIEGVAQMRDNRGGIAKTTAIADGPGKLCQALAVDRQFDGADLTGPDLFLEPGRPVRDDQVKTTTRIGITKSPELLWRFHIADNPHVSKGRPVKP